LADTCADSPAAMGVTGLLTDANGRDLLTGADESTLLQRARRGPLLRGMPMYSADTPALPRGRRTAECWFVIRFPERTWREVVAHSAA
jgi:hypothetical protein